MTGQLVLDCSVAMAWCFPDEVTPRSDELLAGLSRGTRCVVPSHWPLEVASVLHQAERRGRISQDRASQFVTLLDTLPIRVDPETAARALAGIRALARETGLTPYDAAYLELAVRTGSPLATLDDDLRAAAAARGVTVLGA